MDFVGALRHDCADLGRNIEVQRMGCQSPGTTADMRRAMPIMFLARHTPIAPPPLPDTRLKHTTNLIGLFSVF
jgi:hypothetical protein